MTGHPLRGIRALLGLSLLIIMAPAPASAQGRDRLEDELRRTDEMLARAADVVRESESVRARDVLERAFSLQREAYGQCQGGRFALAGRMTLEARQVGGRAVTFAREDAATRDRASREMERADRELTRAREQLGEGPAGEVRRLLDEAQSLLERARVTFAEQQYRPALRLALAAQRLTGHALSSGDGRGGWRLTRDLERTDHLLERLAPHVDETAPPEVGELFGLARDLQRQAWESFRDGRSREARARTHEARRVANRVRTALGAAEDPAAVEDALRETQAVLDRAAEIIRPSDDRTSIALLDRAVEHQLRARSAVEQGNLRRALAQTRVARSIAKRALQMIGKGES